MKKTLDSILGARETDLRSLNDVADKQIQSDILDKLGAIAPENAEAQKLLEALNQDPSFLSFLSSVFQLSPYLRDCALIKPENLATVLSRPFEDFVAETIQRTRNLWRDAESEAAFMVALRKAKRQISLALGLADLGGWLQAEKITYCLTEFGDAALGATCDFLLSEFHNTAKIVLDDPQQPSKASGLIVLGMGKFGAHELNYSSDIDIILFFDLSRKMTLTSADPTSLFVRFAKRLSRILQERTGDGYVFRVDLRLRPDPGSTPLVIPVETAFNYYEAYGQNWERAAFIKARSVAGDIECGQQFLKELAPFIWRKYLDFAAIQDVHSIKRQIHAHKGHGEIAVKGHNVKLGRGGIREVEFFVQTQQLIAGGRREQLRKIGTIAGLYALRDDGWIATDTAEELKQAYWYLRSVEHRIQMVRDEQTHTLPEDDDGLQCIAYMMGYTTTAEFSQDLIATMQTVEKHYAALFEASPELAGKGGNLVFTGDDEDPGTLETISDLGFKQPSQIISTVKGWHYGRYNAVRSAPAREMLTEITPALIEAFSETQNPDQAFFGFDRFLAGLPAGIQFFSILKSNPKLVRLLTTILGSAPRLAEIITRKPNVFDGLIDPSFGASVPSKSELAQRLTNALDRAGGYEAKLDQARLFSAEQKFLIGIRLINRTINARQAGLAFTDLAETMLTCILKAARSEFELKHGKIANGQIAILGMGRLGSCDLTSSSDLDLIFLYSHPDDAEPSKGDKQLYPQQYFIRLVQRLITAMSAPMAEGIVYELDFRLRPSGNSGPLATHISSFVKYQREEAWIWEKQSLVRARVIAGDEHLVGEIEKHLCELRSSKLEVAKVSREIAEMRATLDKEKPAFSLFDVKRSVGGLIDIEFLTQWAALTNKVANGGKGEQQTLKLIEGIDDASISMGDKEVLKNAYIFFNDLLQIQRVCLKEDFDTKNTENGFVNLLCEQTSMPNIKALEVELKARQKNVRKIFKATLG